MSPVTELRLYTSLKTRGGIVEWYLQELGLKYDAVVLDMQKGEHKEEGYLTKVNPYGTIPAFEHGSLTLTESGAIMLYLADKFDAKVQTAEDRARQAQWVLFSSTTLATALFYKDKEGGKFEALLSVLQSQLGDKQFLEGNKFSLADVAVGSHLLFTDVFMPELDLSKWPALAAYKQRMAERPACRATVGAGLKMYSEKKTEE